MVRLTCWPTDILAWVQPAAPDLQALQLKQRTPKAGKALTSSMSGASIERRLKMAGSQLNVSAACRSWLTDTCSGCGSPFSMPGHTLAPSPPADALGLHAARRHAGWQTHQHREAAHRL